MNSRMKKKKKKEERKWDHPLVSSLVKRRERKWEYSFNSGPLFDQEMREQLRIAIETSREEWTIKN